MKWENRVRDLPTDDGHQEAEIISVCMLENAELKLLWKKDFPICVVLDFQRIR